MSAPHYSADGRFLGVTFEGSDGGADTSVVVWDLASPDRPVLRFDVPGFGYELDLSPDGSRVYVGRADPPEVTAYEVATGRALRSVSVPGAWLEVSPDGSLLAAAGGTEVVLLDEATFNEVRRLQGHGDQVRVIRFSPSGAQLASGSEDRTTMVWDVTTGERRDLLQGSPTGVWGVGFGPDGNTLYTSGGQAVLTWDLTGERRFIRRLPLVEPAAPWGPSAGGAEGSPVGDAVAYTGCLADDGPALLQFLDLGTGRAGPLIDTGHRCYGSFVWRPDGARYATAGYDGFVRVWDWHTGELIVERHVAPMLITGLDYTGDGRRLVVAEREGTTYAIDAETLEPDGKSIELGKPVANVYASPDNHTAIVLTTGGFSLVDLDNGRVVRDGEADDPFAGDFSPDGHRFAVGSGSGGVRMLDVDTGEWAGPPRAGHNGLIYSVDYAEDGATFVTGSRRSRRHPVGRPNRRGTEPDAPGTARRRGDAPGVPRRRPHGADLLVRRSGLHPGHQDRTLGRGRVRHRRSEPHRHRVDGHLRYPSLPRDVSSRDQHMTGPERRSTVRRRSGRRPRRPTRRSQGSGRAVTGR